MAFQCRFFLYEHFRLLQQGKVVEENERVFNSKFPSSCSLSRLGFHSNAYGTLFTGPSRPRLIGLMVNNNVKCFLDFLPRFSSCIPSLSELENFDVM